MCALRPGWPSRCLPLMRCPLAQRLPDSGESAAAAAIPRLPWPGLLSASPTWTRPDFAQCGVPGQLTSALYPWASPGIADSHLVDGAGVHGGRGASRRHRRHRRSSGSTDRAGSAAAANLTPVQDCGWRGPVEGQAASCVPRITSCARRRPTRPPGWPPRPRWLAAISTPSRCLAPPAPAPRRTWPPRGGHGR
jgi:hypothetical protein